MYNIDFFTGNIWGFFVLMDAFCIHCWLVDRESTQSTFLLKIAKERFQYVEVHLEKQREGRSI